MNAPGYLEKLSIPVRHDFCRAIYLTLLQVLPGKEVLAFYSQTPLTLDDRPVSLPDLLRLLWAEKAEVTMKWLYDMGESLEYFLTVRGIDAYEFLRMALWRNNQGSHMPGKVILSWFSPKIGCLFKSFDGRDALVSMFQHFTENFLPYHLHRRLRRTAEADCVHADLAYIIDRDFEVIHEWNFELIAGTQILYSPLIFGMQPFEAVGMLSDTRSLEKVTWKSGFSRVGGAVLLDGRPIAVATGFSAFCDKLGIDLSPFHVPDREVFVAVEDVACERRRRIVLHAGCAYGAPLFLHRVTYRKTGNNRADFLDPMLRDANEAPMAPSREIAARHIELLHSLEECLRIAYLAADESIVINGKPFVKGLGAKILKNLIVLHLASGRTEFEYWELKKCHDITGGWKPQNFEIRFYRLMEKLDAENRGIRIAKAGRGKFTLEVRARLDFSEKP